MGVTEKRFYKSVDANTSETDEFIPPAGTFFINLLGGSAGTSPDTVVIIVWDDGGASEEILFATHGDASQKPSRLELAADGVKKLEIKLINDQSTSDHLGGFWTGSD